MLHIFAWVDPVSPVLDAKQLGLTFVSVMLFIGALALQIAINSKLQTIVDDIAVLKVKGETNDKEVGVIKTACEALKVQITNASDEAHEQWSKLNDLEQTTRDSALRVEDIKDSAGTISHQLTVLATSQLNQTQQTQKVIDSLIEVLQDHSRS